MCSDSQVKKNSSPPLSLYGQLLWREFFYTAATNNPRFDKMEGNPICVQIPWDKNPEALAKWAEGRTGFPWIDAIMTQLRQEGWIHHLARHAVACFLTRGDLWISWEEGMKVCFSIGEFLVSLLQILDWYLSYMDILNAFKQVFLLCSLVLHNRLWLSVVKIFLYMILHVVVLYNDWSSFE